MCPALVDYQEDVSEEAGDAEHMPYCSKPMKFKR